MSRRFLAIAVLAVAVPALVAPLAAGSSPAKAKAACEDGTTKDGVTTIPIRVVKLSGAIAPLVNVCIDGKGPYPMMLDTGAAISVISTELAEELGLRKVGPPGKVGGASCTTKSQTFELPSMSVGGIELEGGAITTIDMPGRTAGLLQGSLGAEILSRFGAARLDYRRETLTLSGEEGPRFKPGQKSAGLPKGLLDGKPELVEPMNVERGPGGSIAQSVEVKVGSLPAQPWLVDTGSSTTVVSPAAVKKAGLKPTGKVERAGTACKVINVHEYEAPSLALASGKLQPQTIVSFNGLLSQFGGGILGSSSLAKFGSVIFDWAGRKLLLGAG
jgi:hypothetical protein